MFCFYIIPITTNCQEVIFSSPFCYTFSRSTYIQNFESNLDITLEVEATLLERSGQLSWDEQKLIEYIRNHPDREKEIIKLINSI